ncbi:peptidylprolyl isomerase [Paenibacillaceae bacterium]|nr:peptidylprolyl isomerase [Paenibacillaceae bacterium]
MELKGAETMKDNDPQNNLDQNREEANEHHEDANTQQTNSYEVLENSSEQGSNESAVPAGGATSKVWMGVSLVLFGLLIVMAVFNPFGSTSASGGTVATVNGVSISKDKLYDELVSVAGEQALDGLIMKELIDQEFSNAKLTIADEDIDKEYNNFKSGAGSEEEFQMYLMQSGMTEERLRGEMRLRVQLAKLLGPDVTVTDEEVLDFYQQNQSKWGAPEMVKVSHILVENKEEADAILAELKNGADFAKLAAEKSIDPGSKDNGGVYDFFPRGTMVPEFEEAAFGMKNGELSDVVPTDYGFHIIKTLEHKEAEVKLEDKKEEIVGLLTQNKVLSLAGSWYQGVEEKSEINNSLKPVEPEKAEETTETTDPSDTDGTNGNESTNDAAAGNEKTEEPAS